MDTAHALADTNPDEGRRLNAILARHLVRRRGFLGSHPSNDVRPQPRQYQPIDADKRREFWEQRFRKSKFGLNHHPARVRLAQFAQEVKWLVVTVFDVIGDVALAERTDDVLELLALSLPAYFPQQIQARSPWDGAL
jgi:hypothetical protein